MSDAAMRWCAAQRFPGQPVRKAVLAWLCWHFNDAKGAAWPSVTTLAREVDTTEGNIRKHLRALRDAGLIAVEERRRDDGGTTTNVYRLPPLPAAEAPAPLSPETGGAIPGDRGEAVSGDRGRVSPEIGAPSPRRQRPPVSQDRGPLSLEIGQEHQGEHQGERQHEQATERAAPQPTLKAAPLATRKAAAPAREPSKQAAVVDAIRAGGADYHLSPRDAAAIKRTTLAPEEIAAAYLAAHAGTWGDDWLRQNLSVHLVIDRYGGFAASKSGPPAAGRGRGGRPLRGASAALADIEEELGAVAWVDARPVERPRLPAPEGVAGYGADEAATLLADLDAARAAMGGAHE